MDYTALSPHVGAWAMRDYHLGDSSLRGGAINWGNIGSRLSSALSSTGRWLYNQGNRFLQSNTFNQIKQGIHDSGVIRNAAGLAGETLNALTDIGRLKIQHDLEKLRRKATGEDQPASQAELQALIQALQAQMAAAPSSVPAAAPVAPMAPPSAAPAMAPTSAPVVPAPVAPVAAAAVDVPPPAKRRRKRPTYGRWRDRLNTLSGTGVTTHRRRMCY
ncbi:pVI [Duck adenovirus 4]|uniref:PVI n=1 Tax=Duck adenovirus 4 TaxID=2726020 RepID=A0A6M3Q9F7_9ADEN|nr:pVI [Duck adenovirus 4]